MTKPKRKWKPDETDIVTIYRRAREAVASGLQPSFTRDLAEAFLRVCELAGEHAHAGALRCCNQCGFCGPLFIPEAGCPVHDPD